MMLGAAHEVAATPAFGSKLSLVALFRTNSTAPMRPIPRASPISGWSA